MRVEPWPGRTRLERTFVLLDVGVSFANPCWHRATNQDGTVVEADPLGANSWHVDLVRVQPFDAHAYAFLDLYLDVIVPTDGRAYRMLDLDEFADAIVAGTLSINDAVDGLRRWQRFLDRYLHEGRWPSKRWSDFPPARIRDLANIPAPLADPVRWNG